MSIFNRLFYVEQESSGLHQLRYSFLSIRHLIFIVLALLTTGCKSEDPIPEIRDQIFQHLSKEQKDEEKNVEELKKTLESVKKELESSALDRVDRIAKTKELKKTELKFLASEQKARHLKIKAERRRLEARRSYKIAFQNDQPWPDSSEYKKFLTYRSLADADLNWAKRVPKLFHTNPNFKTAAKEKPKQEGGGH